MTFLNMASAIAREFAGNFLLNFIFLFTYIFILYVLRVQYEKYIGLKSTDTLRSGKSIRELVKASAFFGAVSGFVSSFIVIFIGITLDARTFELIFMLTIGLSLINIRYICFAYSGGIISLGSAVMGWTGVDIPSILALIAVLHLVEGIMVSINSGKDCIPVLIKNKNGIAGAFFIQKFWPVPVVIPAFLTGKSVEGFGDMITGKWFMLFKPGVAEAGILSLGLGCIIAVLGYSDVAITKTPEMKSREAALWIFVYSISMFIIAVLSAHFAIVKFAGPVFAVAAHEFIILFRNYREKHGEPIFKTEKRGIKVLEVLPDSAAQTMGIQRGDTILSINGRDIQTDEGMTAALEDFPTFIWIDISDSSGNKKTYEYRCYPSGTNNLGVLTVPRENAVTYNVEYFENVSVLKNLVSRFKGTGSNI